ncbi:MAG: hypothetical protein KatS3mg115_1728 [Candidatus Poribacteria bacterium]|nr:MAG: hypothetical protein KatS3mg115_1728 [Candidatus Poribacteria bacterium]
MFWTPFALLGIPGPPVLLDWTLQGRRVFLFWTPTTPELTTGYRVYQNGAPAEAVTELFWSATLPEGQRVELFVRAVGPDGSESAPSETLVLGEEGLKLGAPTNVRVTNRDGGVTLQWDLLPNAVSYQVHWGLGPESLNNVVEVPGTMVFLDGLANGVAYFFSVAGVDFQGQVGEFSEPVRGSPRSGPLVPTATVPLRNGFPVEAGDDFFAAPVVVDLNGDGRAEIYAPCSDGKLYAWDARGRPLSGFPLDLGEPIVDTLAVGDVDHDGKPELVGAAGQSVYVWRSGGTPLQGFPVRTPNVIRAHPVLANVDLDPELEIFVAVAEGESGVYAWDHQGQPLENFPLLLEPGSYVYAAPAIGDANFDGRAEITVAAWQGAVYSWTVDGNPRPGFPVLPEGGVVDRSSPTLVPLDPGRLSLLFAGELAGAVAYEPQGEVRNGFPKTLLSGTPAPLTIGDLDGDGEWEILAVDEDGLLYAWREDGTPVPGYPLRLGTAARAPLLTADLDNDGADEVVFIANEPQNSGALVLLLEGDGSARDYIQLDVNVDAAPVLADLEGDGNVELVLATLHRPENRFDPVNFPELGGRVFVYELSARMSRATWTQLQGNPQRTGVPIELLPPPSRTENFRALRRLDGVALSWSSSQELGNLGWIVSRSTSPTGPFQPVSETPIRARRTTAGASAAPQEYQLLDRNADPNRRYYYLLENLGSNDRTVLYGPVEVGPLAEEIALLPWGRLKRLEVLSPFPSPANPEVWVPFRLGADAFLTLRIYDLQGALVRTIPLGHLPAGDYTDRGRAARWNGRNALGEPVPSGLYVLELDAGEVSARRRIFIVK